MTRAVNLYLHLAVMSAVVAGLFVAIYEMVAH